jgi:hypothetical protein
MEQRSQNGPNDSGYRANIHPRDSPESGFVELDEFRAQVGNLRDRLIETIRERPGTALLVAIGAGFLVGRLVRS